MVIGFGREVSSTLYGRISCGSGVLIGGACGPDDGEAAAVEAARAAEEHALEQLETKPA